MPIDNAVASGNQIVASQLASQLSNGDWVLLKSSTAIDGVFPHNEDHTPYPEELHQVSSTNGNTITLVDDLVDDFVLNRGVIKLTMLTDFTVKGIEITGSVGAGGHFLGLHYCADVTLDDIVFRQGSPGGIVIENCGNVQGNRIEMEGFFVPVNGDTFGVIFHGGCANCSFTQFSAKGTTHTMTTTSHNAYSNVLFTFTPSSSTIIELDNGQLSSYVASQFPAGHTPVTYANVMTLGNQWSTISTDGVNQYIMTHIQSTGIIEVRRSLYPARWGTPRKITFDGGIHRAGQWLLFSIPEGVGYVTDLNNNSVQSWLTGAFSTAGYALTSATISDVVDDVEWQITDTLTNGVKKRYVIKNEDGDLNVYVNASYAFSPHAEGYDIRIKNSHVFVDMPGNVSCVLMRTRNSGAENVHFHGYPSNPQGPLEGGDYPSAFAKGYHAQADNNDVLDCVIETTFQGLYFEKSDYTGHTSSGNVYRYNGRMGILNYTTGVTSTNDVFIDNGGRNPGKSFYNDAILVRNDPPSEMTIDGGVFWHSDNQDNSIDTNGGTNSGHITVQNSIAIGFSAPSYNLGITSNVVPLLPSGAPNHIVPDSY
ncbi:MAG: hypothetical protein R3E01_21355 [Pirellulaceae bacterium]